MTFCYLGTYGINFELGSCVIVKDREIVFSVSKSHQGSYLDQIIMVILMMMLNLNNMLLFVFKYMSLITNGS